MIIHSQDKNNPEWGFGGVSIIRAIRPDFHLPALPIWGTSSLNRSHVYCIVLFTIVNKIMFILRFPRNEYS